MKPSFNKRKPRKKKEKKTREQKYKIQQQTLENRQKFADARRLKKLGISKAETAPKPVFTWSSQTPQALALLEILKTQDTGNPEMDDLTKTEARFNNEEVNSLLAEIIKETHGDKIVKNYLSRLRVRAFATTIIGKNKTNAGSTRIELMREKSAETLLKPIRIQVFKAVEKSLVKRAKELEEFEVNCQKWEKTVTAAREAREEAEAKTRETAAAKMKCENSSSSEIGMNSDIGSDYNEEYSPSNEDDWDVSDDDQVDDSAWSSPGAPTWNEIQESRGQERADKSIKEAKESNVSLLATSSTWGSKTAIGVTTSLPTCAEIPTLSTAEKIMQKQGWKPGTGLGKNSQGDPAPLSSKITQVRKPGDHSGLGYGPLPKPNELDSLQSDSDDEDLATSAFGQRCSNNTEQRKPKLKKEKNARSIT